MNIVIAGAGAVGIHLAKWLSGESHDITLIDCNQERLSNIDSSIDAITIAGEATNYRVLKRARVDSADLFISVTSVEEANILSAIYAKKFGAKRTIARISQMQYLTEPKTLNIKELGIDELISPESLAAREVRHLVNTNAASESIEFENGKITLLGLDIDEDAEVVGKTIAEVASTLQERKYVVVAIKREGETIIPQGDTEIKIGDHLFAITHPEGLEEVLSITGKRKIKVNNIVVLGGSRTGRHLARKLGKEYHMKLIEKDLEKSREIAEDYPDVLVLNFDGTDVEKLEEEGIGKTDVFVAVTGNSETNVLACLVAKKHGVKKTIAMVENLEYLNLSHGIGIDSLINKKLAAANFIYRYIRRGDFISLSTIHGLDAEVMEFNIKKECKVTKNPIKNIGLPKGALIGGVVRHNQGLIPTGEFTIQVGDRVIVFSKVGCSQKTSRYFR